MFTTHHRFRNAIHSYCRRPLYKLYWNCRLATIESAIITQVFTSTYHPQCDGFVERINGVIIQIIAMYVASDHKDRDAHLPSAPYTYNLHHQPIRNHRWHSRLTPPPPLPPKKNKNKQTKQQWGQCVFWTHNWESSCTPSIVEDIVERTSSRKTGVTMKRGWVWWSKLQF